MDRAVSSGFVSGSPKSAQLPQPEVPFGRRAGSMRSVAEHVIAQDAEAQGLLAMPLTSPLGTCSATLMASGSHNTSPRRMGSSNLRVQQQQDTSSSVPLPHNAAQQPRSVSPAKPLSAFQSLLDARLEATSRALALEKESSYTLPRKESSGLSLSVSTPYLSDQLASGEAQHPSLIVRVATRQSSFNRSVRKGSIFPVSMQANDKSDELPVLKSGKSFNVQELRQQAAAKASTGNVATQFFKRVLKGIGMGSDDPAEPDKPSPSDRSVRPEHPTKKAAERKPREFNYETAPEDASRRLGAKAKPLLGADPSTHVMRSMARMNCRW